MRIPAPAYTSAPTCEGRLKLVQLKAYRTQLETEAADLKAMALKNLDKPETMSVLFRESARLREMVLDSFTDKGAGASTPDNAAAPVEPVSTPGAQAVKAVEDSEADFDTCGCGQPKKRKFQRCWDCNEGRAVCQTCKVNKVNPGFQVCLPCERGESEPATATEETAENEQPTAISEYVNETRQPEQRVCFHCATNPVVLYEDFCEPCKAKRDAESQDVECATGCGTWMQRNTTGLCSECRRSVVSAEIKERGYR